MRVVSTLQQQRHHASPVASTSRPSQQVSRRPAMPVAAIQQRAGAAAVLARPSNARRRTLHIAAGMGQSSNQATKRRLGQGIGLPPVPGDDGGGGGGDGWNWERTARNVAPNLFFLGLYFFITSYGGDGWNGGFFGGGGGGGGGDGGGGAGQPNDGGSSLRDSNAQQEDNDDEQGAGKGSDSDDEPPVFVSSYSGGRGTYRGA
jgi:hypothetical protein